MARMFLLNNLNYYGGGAYVETIAEEYHEETSQGWKHNRLAGVFATYEECAARVRGTGSCECYSGDPYRCGCGCYSISCPPDAKWHIDCFSGCGGSWSTKGKQGDIDYALDRGFDYIVITSGFYNSYKTEVDNYISRGKNIYLLKSKSGGTGPDGHCYNIQFEKITVCISKWQCEPWGLCLGGKQTRTCTDGCGNTKTEEQTCCTPSWSCGDWTQCTDGKETRACTDSCGNSKTEEQTCLSEITCTADVKKCPDGSFVSRNPDNNCEFYPCPTDEAIKGIPNYILLIVAGIVILIIALWRK